VRGGSAVGRGFEGCRDEVALRREGDGTGGERGWEGEAVAVSDIGRGEHADTFGRTGWIMGCRVEVERGIGGFVLAGNGAGLDFRHARDPLRRWGGFAAGWKVLLFRG
jgi:hypothetical protein